MTINTTKTGYDAAALIEEIHAFGRQHADDGLRVIPMAEQGEYVAQGDVLFWPLETQPDNLKPAEPVAQLAPGNSRGSRHCIRQADLRKVDFYQFEHPAPLEGPVLYLREDIVVEHPEHGDQLWSGGQWVAVTYQLKHGDEVRRIQD